MGLVSVTIRMSWECSCPNEGVLEPGGAGARTGCRAPELAASSPEFAALEPKGCYQSIDAYLQYPQAGCRSHGYVAK